jgi:hypothetical protein
MKRSPARLATIAVLLLSGFLGGEASASVVRLTSVRLPLEYRTWTLKDREGNEETVSQFYLPAITTVQVTSATAVVLSTAGAGSSRKLEQSSSFSGPSDVKVQAYHKAADNRVLFTGGVNLPTGKRELSLEDLEIVRALGNPLLGMRLKQYGRGLDLNGGAALSVPLRPDLLLAVGAGVLLPGSFTLVKGDQAYSPTPEISVSAGLEVRGPRWAPNAQRLSLQATGRLYSKDQVAGEDVFEEGDQLDVALNVVTNRARLRLSLASLLVLKRDNVSFTAEGDELRALKSSPGTGLLTRAGLNYELTDRVRPGIEIDWKRFSGSDDPERNGFAFGVGPALGLALGESNRLKIRALYHAGSAGGREDEIDLKGLSTTVSFTWRPSF